MPLKLSFSFKDYHLIIFQFAIIIALFNVRFFKWSIFKNIFCNRKQNMEMNPKGLQHVVFCSPHEKKKKKTHHEHTGVNVFSW